MLINTSFPQAWLCDGTGDVAIFDATNTTDDRRRRVLEHALEVSDSTSPPDTAWELCLTGGARRTHAFTARCVVADCAQGVEASLPPFNPNAINR